MIFLRFKRNTYFKLQISHENQEGWSIVYFTLSSLDLDDLKMYVLAWDKSGAKRKHFSLEIPDTQNIWSESLERPGEFQAGLKLDSCLAFILWDVVAGSGLQKYHSVVEIELSDYLHALSDGEERLSVAIYEALFKTILLQTK